MSADKPIPTPDLDGLGMQYNGNLTDWYQISLVRCAALSTAFGDWEWRCRLRRRLRIGLTSTTTARS
jgi:hypothetical protein